MGESLFDAERRMSLASLSGSTSLISSTFLNESTGPRPCHKRKIEPLFGAERQMSLPSLSGSTPQSAIMGESLFDAERHMSLMSLPGSTLQSAITSLQECRGGSGQGRMRPLGDKQEALFVEPTHTALSLPGSTPARAFALLRMSLPSLPRVDPRSATISLQECRGGSGKGRMRPLGDKQEALFVEPTHTALSLPGSTPARAFALLRMSLLSLPRVDPRSATNRATTSHAP